MRILECLCVLVIGATPALGGAMGGTDPWMDGWYVNGDLSRTGINENNVTTFGPNDPRLGPNAGNNGTTSGGMFWSHDEHGAYNGGDNVRVLINRDLSVPAGDYNFEVSWRGYVYWNVLTDDVNVTDPGRTWQPWGLGQSWFLGNPATLDYGNWPPGGTPEGPWQGSGWAGEGDSRLYRLFNGVNPDDNTEVWEDAPPNGVWYDFTRSQTEDGTNVISTTGTVTFRMASQFKVRNYAGETMTVATDDLSITLTPVGVGDPIIFTDMFLPEPTSLTLLGLGAIPLLCRGRRRARRTQDSGGIVPVR